VPAASIRTDGRGAREPIADNNTDAGRAQNRRVEIYVGERPQG
jgi:flagellar motor protein MotB